MKKITESKFNEIKKELKNNVKQNRKWYRKEKSKQVALVTLSVFTKILMFAGMATSLSITAPFFNAFPALTVLAIGMSGLAAAFGGFFADKKIKHSIDKTTKALAYPEESLENAKYFYNNLKNSYEIFEDEKMDNNVKVSIAPQNSKEQTYYMPKTKETKVNDNSQDMSM